MKKITNILMISILALILSTTIPSTKAAPPNPTTTVYIHPASITATEVNQEFTIEIRINKVTDLYGWDIGLTWNATALECLTFTEGTFLKTSGFSTIGVDGTINNTAGEIYPQYGRALMGAPKGVNGSSTDPDPVYGTKGSLANATFRAKAVGTFNIHLAETELWDSYASGIPFNRIDFFTVTYEQAYLVVTESNLTGLARRPYRRRISNYIFSQSAMQVTFDVFAPSGEFGTTFCNVTIPKPLLSDNATHPWHVYLNTTANEIGYTEAENATHSALYFTYPIGNHKIIIQGAEVIPEFPTALILPLLIITALTATTLAKKAKPTKRKKPPVTK